jgi:uracil-DNA glycosylase family protein
MPSSDQSLSAQAFLPARRNWRSVRRAAKQCQGCPLFAQATQTVFGEGPAKAAVVFVGEQPGDVEDRVGRPFVGPAGQLFDKLLAEASLSRDDIYVTNAVKHFKWKPRGKRRLHAKPASREIMACRPWLEVELELLQPYFLICLGATASQALFGKSFSLTRQRGTPFPSQWAPFSLATYHPSALLRSARLPGGTQMRDEFLADLRLVANELKDGVRSRQKLE